MGLKDLVFDFNKVVVDPSLRETIKELSEIGLSLPKVTPNMGQMYDDAWSKTSDLVVPVGDIERVNLDAHNGQQQMHAGKILCAYDESINKFSCLEGTAFSTSHSCVVLGTESYVPVNYITFYFYTRSEVLAGKSQYIRLSGDPEMDSRKDYIRDRIQFLEAMVPEHSIVLIDGPLIGGDVYTILMRSIDAFHAKDAVPIFFVKNSSSNLVVDNITSLRAKFNSDLHWAYSFLAPGQRSNFFVYRDRVNPSNAKAFCYLKGFNLSPQRVEFHLGTFERYSGIIADLMDLVYYLLIVQGNPHNPQVRPIAVAEMYARETLAAIDLFDLMKNAGITPTMNQVRFGG